MKTILLALSLLLAPLATAQEPDHTVALGETPGPTDVRIESALGSGYQCGSGTLCGRSKGGTIAITNHHVIEGSRDLYVLVSGLKYEATLLDSNKRHDVALLEVPAKLPFVTLGGNATEGEQLHYRAFDCGVHFRTWWAEPSQTYSVGGNSGGGVYHKGRLVGVIWGNKRNRIAFTPIQRVRGMIQKYTVAE